MGANTKIEWTDSTWGPVRGCSRVSEGCRNCYAEIMAARFSKPGQWGHGFAEMKGGDHRWTGKVELIESQLTLPLTWRAPRKIFVNSTSDLFHEALPDEAIDRVFAVMALCPQHCFQILTKRPDRMRAYFAHDDGFGRWGYIESRARKIAIDRRAHVPSEKTLATYGGKNLPNVWLGVSVEDQERADERIPHLLATPAAVRFLSCEPLLGPIDLAEWLEDGEPTKAQIEGPRGLHYIRHGAPRVDWCITGSESGPGSRDCDLAWVRALRDQCVASEVPFFWKQHAVRGKKIPTPELDGRRWTEFPEPSP